MKAEPSMEKKLNKEHLDELWISYQKTKDLSAYERLISYYLPEIKYVAVRIHSKMPSYVQLDDLFQDGFMGLVKAISTYDSSRGTPFEGYCKPKIRGAILDGLNRTDWVPRLVRSRMHQKEIAYQRLISKTGKVPTDKEVADEMGIGIETFKRIKRDASPTKTLPIDETISDEEIRPQIISEIQNKKSPDPSAVIEDKELFEYCILQLTETELHFIRLYYFEYMSTAQIAKKNGTSCTEVIEKHRAILARLRAINEGELL